METFATLNITDIEKYKKLNMTEDKTDMNITEIKKYKKTEQHFYDGAQADMNITKIEKYETLDMTFTLTGH